MAAKDKVTILNLDNFEMEESEVEVQAEEKLIAAINDKTIACLSKYKKNYNTLYFLNIYHLDGLKMIKKVNKEVDCIADFLFRTSDKSFVGPRSSDTQVWDVKGNLIEELKKVDVRNKYPADMLADNILIGTGYHCSEFVKIWNCETGECLKEFKKSIYVGKTSFGFLISNKDKTDCVEAYRMDENFTYLGTIYTGVLSNSTLKRIIHLAANYYLFKFDNSSRLLVEIEWECKLIKIIILADNLNLLLMML
jgi:WD40 repeat protein